MPESQNTEYKKQWRDEWLKWVCGFANADGGKLYIGIDDKGTVTGVADYKKLLEDIPNKIVSYLGILADVNLRTKSRKRYLEIVVQPSSVPISYHGSYHYRTGSTKQELKGPALQQFLLRKIGKSWDEIPVDGAHLRDIDSDAVASFLAKATVANRLPASARTDKCETALANLRMITFDRKLKNAAILLFGKSPQTAFISATFKIGRFGKSDSDLKFQDVIEGNILDMPDKVLTILRSKYLTSPIGYEGLHRIEHLEYPELALREAILNAVVHKDYTGAGILLSIYDDRLILWNPGCLPEDLSIEMLKRKHPSRPRNRTIADIFFKAGYIEAWGRGVDLMVSQCRQRGMPEPVIEEISGGVQITFSKAKLRKNVPGNVPGNVPIKREEKILSLLKERPTLTIQDIARLCGVTAKTIKRDMDKLKAQEIIKRHGPAKGGHWEVVGG